MIHGTEVMSVEWRTLVPGELIHVGGLPVQPIHTKLYYATCTGTNNLYTTADANGLTLKSLIDAGARHLLIQGQSADVFIGFGEAAVSGQSILAPAKSIYRIENIGLLAKYLFLLSTGPVVAQAFK